MKEDFSNSARRRFELGATCVADYECTHERTFQRSAFFAAVVPCHTNEGLSGTDAARGSINKAGDNVCPRYKRNTGPRSQEGFATRLSEMR